MKYAVEKLLDLPHYTEGPAVDGAGNWYFTTLTGGKIYRIDRQGTHSVWAETTCPNGQLVLPNGEHWVCDSRNAAVAKFNGKGQFVDTLIGGTCAGEPVAVPNDLVLDSRQNLYFTDSVREEGKVFFVGQNGQERLVARGLDFANGLVLDSSETRLYVAESYRNRIATIALSGPGISAGKPKVFAKLPTHPSRDPTRNLPDGLALDRRGNLWVAHYGMGAVQVLSPAGDLLYTFDTQLPLTSNLCFLEDTPTRQVLMVTGGYGEPGPGGVVLLTVQYGGSQITGA